MCFTYYRNEEKESDFCFQLSHPLIIYHLSRRMLILSRYFRSICVMHIPNQRIGFFRGCAIMITFNVVLANKIAMSCFGICFSAGEYRKIFTFAVVNICPNYMSYKSNIFVHLVQVKLQTELIFSLELIICFRLTDRIDLLNEYEVNIQLFRQRLSHRSVKAYAKMSIGILGRKSLTLID